MQREARVGRGGRGRSHEEDVRRAVLADEDRPGDCADEGDALRPAHREAADRFEQTHPNARILISTGPTNALARQILLGAPADILVSANDVRTDTVVDQFPRSQSIALTGNRLVLITPKQDIAGVSNPADLAAPNVTRIAIAGERVPAGVYSQQSLRWLGIFDTLVAENRLVRGRDVRSVLAYVHRAEVDAGIVYATDARLSDQVRIVCPLAPESHDLIVYSATLMMKPSSSQTNGRREAHACFKSLQSADVKSLFDQHGFSHVAADQRSSLQITGH